MKKLEIPTDKLNTKKQNLKWISILSPIIKRISIERISIEKHAE